MKTRNVFIKSVILCLFMLACVCGVSQISYAANVDTPVTEEPVEPMEFIGSYGGNLSISNSGVAMVTGYTRGKSGVNDAYVKVTLQKKILGVWSNIQSWEDQGGRNAAVDETYSVSNGTYRVKVYCSAGTETKTLYSASKTV